MAYPQAPCMWYDRFLDKALDRHTCVHAVCFVGRRRGPVPRRGGLLVTKHGPPGYSIALAHTMQAVRPGVFRDAQGCPGTVKAALAAGTFCYAAAMAQGTDTKIAEFHGEPAYVLSDGNGAHAWIVPSLGNNCIAFQTPVAGRTAHLLSTPASADVLRSRPTFWGFPILSPCPGRHQVPFLWRDCSYTIAANDRPGVAIHGIVAGAPWQVVAATSSRLICRFDSEQFPGRADRWPWPFVLTATHRVEGGALVLELEVENRAAEEVPHMLGLHPYFPLRFTPQVAGAGGENGAPEALPTAAELVGDNAFAGSGTATRQTCLVWVAADELWEMKQGLATGDIRRLEGAWDLRRPRAVADMERELAAPPGAGGGQFRGEAASHSATPRLPVLLYGKRAALRSPEAGTDTRGAGGVLSGIRDIASQIELTLESSAGFGALALFCPDEQPFISLEPRSAVSDALTLMNDPRALATGVWPLPPGGRWGAWARLSASPIAPDA